VPCVLEEDEVIKHSQLGVVSHYSVLYSGTDSEEENETLTSSIIPNSNLIYPRIGGVWVGVGSGAGRQIEASGTVSDSASSVQATDMVPAKSKNGSGRIMSDESINEALLEKLRQCALKPAENMEQLRSVAARLHSRAGSQGKN
ncbi:hypothetical protein J6590_066515, partial [Homalodisca vitripennis]